MVAFVVDPSRRKEARIAEFTTRLAKARRGGDIGVERQMIAELERLGVTVDRPGPPQRTPETTQAAAVPERAVPARPERRKPRTAQ